MANILITGANQGIGYFMAEKFLSQGDSVAVLDVETDHLAALQQQYPSRLLPLHCDVRDSAQVAGAVAAAAEAFSVIDIAIHNACLCTFAPLAQTDEATYQAVFDVNYFGAVRLVKAVLPLMERQQSGRFLLVSSGVGIMGFGSISPYASSKGALESLAKCLSIEYEHQGITFHIVHPPITRTRSAAPFPLPEEFKADPKTVGYGIAAHSGAKSFLICHSFGQKVQTQLCYLLSLRMGRFMSHKMEALRPNAAEG